jgi:hypothetical protein
MNQNRKTPPCQRPARIGAATSMTSRSSARVANSVPPAAGSYFRLVSAATVATLCVPKTYATRRYS